ncbi:TetR/AcrR family transcriptional regulator [Yinghuangia seranimata]|uniref:TetR/AcrR family transcriptional regulator n=1 Tax=Yinghuangia seranimata TaxID=408067 RepID=UPI00248AA345|nr:TetR/AcrR family transcriptional regulator [Yinghuangia seranimata]MDI2125330.1 TetR/AcrR family transcriptional regulator [Yinghuangia seranimata]
MGKERVPNGATAATRARLLAEAERLFLAQGYEKVSVRAVNAAAGMNPAAVHYHFGSKEALVVALLQQRLGPLWADRLDALTARRAAGWTPGVAELADIIVRPLDALARTDDGRMLLHLLARVVLGNEELPWDQPWFGQRAWRELLTAIRPDLPEEAVRERWRLAFALLLQAYGQPLVPADRLTALPPPDPAQVAAFIAAGLDAPAPKPAHTPAPASAKEG